MEDWSKDFFGVMENAVSEVEHFFSEMGEEFVEMLDVLAKMSEEFTEQVQNNLINDIDGFFNEFIEPIIEIYRDFDPEFDEIDLSMVTYVDPSPTQQPACRGCRNYHGQVYGGNLLVCAMHPTGVESESCADWETDSDMNF